MTASDLIQYTTWAVYVLIFISTTVKAVRRPLRANIDIALFFLIPALIIVQASLESLGIEEASPVFTAIIVTLFPIMVYMLLRLVDDFSSVPSWLMRVSEGALIIQVIGAFLYTPDFPAWLLLLLFVNLIGLLTYAIVAFTRQAIKTKGVTSRRMSAAAAGTIFLFLDIFFPVLGQVFPNFQGIASFVNILFGLASSIFYFLGFSPPGLLRSAWQEPELRAFLSRATSLPRLPTTDALIAEFEQGAASSIGTQDASIGIWDEAEQALRFNTNGRISYIPADDDSLSGRAFLYQKTIFTEDLKRDSPRAARDGGPAVTLLAAPISTEGRRIGVLVAYSSHVPIFAEEDLRLITLLADQAAVVLESRSLIDEAMRVRTREEITRLKEDFLSAAAHDLKTPLTSLVAQAQLMERRAERKPDTPADIGGIRTIAREATRLKALVLELLDAARADEGKLLGEMHEFDLVALAQEVAARHSGDRHPCTVVAAAPIIGTFDHIRIGQLFENLLENAVKYSPDGGEVALTFWTEKDNVLFSIRDHGIGIPPTDLSSIFERFHRGTNIDDRRFAGMGLGLYICREIVKQHNGKISVKSHRGEGTTFTVELPLHPSVTGAQNLLIEMPNEGQSHLVSAPLVQADADTALPIHSVSQMPFTGHEEGQLT